MLWLRMAYDINILIYLQSIVDKVITHFRKYRGDKSTRQIKGNVDTEINFYNFE